MTHAMEAFPRGRPVGYPLNISWDDPWDVLRDVSWVVSWHELWGGLRDVPWVILWHGPWDILQVVPWDKPWDIGRMFY